MKTKVLLLTLLLMVCGLGCEPTDVDVTKATNWHKWAAGTIMRINERAGPGCTHGDETPDKWCSIAYTIIFTDGTQIMTGHLKKPNFVKVGQSGTLYKFCKAKDKNSWFAWVEDKTQQIVAYKPVYAETEPKKEEPPKVVVKYVEAPVETAVKVPAKPIRKYEWKLITLRTPKKHQIVLVRLKNSIVATAHLNDNDDWKSELSRNRISGGTSITDVVAWKELDLE